MPPPDSDASDSPNPPRKNPPRRDPRLDPQSPPTGDRPAVNRPAGSGAPRPPTSPPEGTRAAKPVANPAKERATPKPVGSLEKQTGDKRTTDKRTNDKRPADESTADESVSEVSLLSRLSSSRQIRIALIAGIGLAVLVLITIGIRSLFFSAGPKQDLALEAEGQDGPDAAQDQAAIPGDLREPRRPVKCRIYSPEPGFVAFIDDQPVRDATGKLLLTPCEVQLERGQHVIRVEKQGWNDISRVAEISSDVEFEQQPVDEPFNYHATTFKAPYLNAKVGEPVLLQTLQLTGRCQDPFVSANGREIWYAGSGVGGIGIYYATRPTPYEEWDTPAILVLSKGTVLPASPSATENGLTVAYTVPSLTGRIWSLFRNNSEEAFDGKKELHYAERGEPSWPSAQLSPDGKRLYWHEIRDDKQSSWVASRFELDLPFSKPKKLSLPGGHPCLSADELRQYAFDGKQLSRAQRTKLDGTFSESKVIAELNLPDYVPHPERRQFWVTEDEQWLYYAENPEANGNLYVVRLHDGPGRGVLVTGKSIQPKQSQSVAELEKPAMPEKETKPAETEVPEKVVVDPRSLPTPYADFQQKLADLLSKRNIVAATALVEAQLKAPETQDSKDLLAWDKAEVAAIQKVWDAAETAIKQLKADEQIKLGGAKFTFNSYSDGVLHLTGSTKKVDRKLRDLPTGEVLLQAEKVLDKGDVNNQLAMGMFLSFEGKAQQQTSKLRMDKAGAVADEFHERQAIRRLKIIEQELARKNLGVALKLIDELAVAFPKSPSTAAAEKHRKQIYSFVAWRQIGGRMWDRGEDGSYVAVHEKKPGALLISENEYGNFDLSLEWRTTSPTGQGGIYFRYDGSGKPLEKAFKIQLANDAGIKPDKFCTGSLFNFNPPTENLAKPDGQWNTLSMQVREERVLVLINGKKVQESLARDAAVPLKGHVALDGEFGGIDYRKILLIEATASPPKK
jgi:hypothetical protein